MESKSKKVKGHKRAKVERGARVVCECGWQSAVWYGRGALAQAHGEYHWHLDQQHVGAEPNQQSAP